MQYFEIANNSSNNVDLFIPNGYSVDDGIDDLIGQELGFVYKLVESDEREGSFLFENSINSIVNDQLKNK